MEKPWTHNAQSNIFVSNMSIEKVETPRREILEIIRYGIYSI